MFGCYGIITCCCKSYHKDTVKFSSNHTISFSRKSTRKDPPVKSDQNKAISVHVLWVSFHHRSTPVFKQPPKNKLTLSTTSVLLLLNVPLSLSRGTVFRRQKNPRREYRPKIAGIVFVCNEPEGKYYTVPSRKYQMTTCVGFRLETMLFLYRRDVFPARITTQSLQRNRVLRTYYSAF